MLKIFFSVLNSLKTLQTHFLIFFSVLRKKSFAVRWLCTIIVLFSNGRRSGETMGTKQIAVFVWFACKQLRQGGNGYGVMSLHYRRGNGRKRVEFHFSGFRATNGKNRQGYRPTISNGVAQAVRTNAVHTSLKLEASRTKEERG